MAHNRAKANHSSYITKAKHGKRHMVSAKLYYNDHGSLKRNKSMTIGLLGGSFNPAHEGHFMISNYLRKRLKLSQVWWLISPNNPLKDKNKLMAYQERVLQAERFSNGRHWLKVSDFENHHQLIYTLDTLKYLIRRYRCYQFVWLMGADNLAILHKWYGWKQIIRLIPIAVYNRPSYDFKALASKAGRYLRKYRVLANNAGNIKYRKKLPAWSMMHAKRSSVSASQLRESLKRD